MRNLAYICVLVLGVGACGGDDAIDSNEEARRAYLGLDPSIPKSLNLGFDGFNSATSANIDAQEGVGEVDGTLTITGQVDQGASDNKEMRLYVGMVDYTDGEFVVIVNDGTEDEEEVTVDLTYNTSDVQLEQPYLHLSLRNVPDGDFTGELTGTYYLSGDIEGEVTLDLTMAGDIQAGPNATVERVPGSTTILGTATSGDGLYDVNVVL
jgi:hypothetical protein